MEIELPPDPSIRPTEAPIELRRQPSFTLVVDNTGQFCTHNAMLVCKKQRRVTCGTCGATLDPFDALNRMTEEYDRWETNKRFLKQDVAKAEHRLAELKALERNAVSRLKRKGVQVDNYYARDYRAGSEVHKAKHAAREQEKLKEVK